MSVTKTFAGATDLEKSFSRWLRTQFPEGLVSCSTWHNLHKQQWHILLRRAATDRGTRVHVSDAGAEQPLPVTLHREQDDEVGAALGQADILAVRRGEASWVVLPRQRVVNWLKKKDRSRVFKTAEKAAAATKPGRPAFECFIGCSKRIVAHIHVQDVKALALHPGTQGWSTICSNFQRVQTAGLVR